jgi:adenine phosphoribosyltransferase
VDLKQMIRTVPDFPKKGVMFRDITTLIQDGVALNEVATLLAERFRAKRPEVVLGIESRGFVIGAAVALKLGVGFVPVRKKGKLPAKTLHAEYALEYGTDCIEIHADAIKPGQRVLLIDDLLATGGTAEAAARLVEQAGGKVIGCGFLIDLAFLKGAEKLKKYEVYSLVRYDSE